MLNKEIIAKEGDAYFDRNKISIDAIECSKGVTIFSEFYDKCEKKNVNRVLEVGCSTGYNLAFLSEQYDMECYGIEPSKKAIEYGNCMLKERNIEKVELRQGFSDELPYPDDFFDMVYLGFCLYQVDRDKLLKTMSECDRVLKRGGYCVITDFDTPIPYLRQNIHNIEMLTYKTDYSKMLSPYGYTLIHKIMYSHSTEGFKEEIQERVSTQIFFKEDIIAQYIKAEL